jgi:hypothetical protein
MFKPLITLTAIVLCSSPASGHDLSDFNRTRKLGWATAAADVASTWDCLRRNTCRELGPLYGSDPSLPKLIAVRVGTEVVFDLLIRQLYKENPNLAYRILQVKVIGTGAVATYNLRF